MLFELVSRLKVNSHKSFLVIMNVNISWLVETSHILNCIRGQTYFNYFGLLIGGNPGRVYFWVPMVERI